MLLFLFIMMLLGLYRFERALGFSWRCLLGGSVYLDVYRGVWVSAYRGLGHAVVEMRGSWCFVELR